MKQFYFSVFLCVCCIITCKGQKIFVDSLMPLVFQEHYTDTRADGINKKAYIGLRVFISPQSQGFAICGKRLNKLTPITPYTNKYYRILDVVSSNTLRKEMESRQSLFSFGAMSSNEWPDKIGSDRDIVKLQEEESGEIIYYTEPNNLISMALFENRQKKYSDKQYVYVDKISSEYHDPFTKQVVSVAPQSEWYSLYTILLQPQGTPQEGAILKNDAGKSIFINSCSLGVLERRFKEKQLIRDKRQETQNQIRTLEENTSYELVEPYDSLAPIEIFYGHDNSSTRKYIGQRVFLPLHHANQQDRAKYDLFTNKYTYFEFGAPYCDTEIFYDNIATYLYKPEELNKKIVHGNSNAGTPTRGYAYYQSNLDSISNHYYLINDIIPFRNQTKLQGLKIAYLRELERNASVIYTPNRHYATLIKGNDWHIIELIREDTRDTVYTLNIFQFISDGYLTKIRDVFERKNLIATNVCRIHDLLSGNTLEFDKSEKIYCQSIEIYDGKIIGKFVADVDGQQKQIAFNIEPRLNDVYLDRILDFEDKSMLAVKSFSIEDFVVEKIVDDVANKIRMETAKREQQKREEAQRKLQQKEAAKRAINLKQIQ